MRRVTLVLAAAAGLGLTATAVTIGAGVISSAPSRPPAQASDPALTDQQQQAAKAYSNLPVSFVENHGQTDAIVKYYAQGNGYAFYMTPSEVMLSLSKHQNSDAKAPDGVALALRFLASNPNVEPRGSELAAGVVNDLRGSDPSKWQTNIAQFRDVIYSDLWPGIDLKLREQSGVLKYEFHVRPGASPADIQLAYGGADGLAVSDAGALQIATPIGMLEDSVPLSYQMIGGVRTTVPSNYVLGSSANVDRFSFDVGSYNPNQELIIDPGVQYSTFLGGNSDEIPNGLAVDASGNAYISGSTQSPDFPTTAGAFDRTGAPQNFTDVFVTKLNSAGTGLVYSTFVGGSDFEVGRRLALDSAGNVYVTGETKSSNFPTTGGAFDRSLNIPPNCPRCVVDNTDGFVFKLNAAGSALTYSTYLGGTDIDSPRDIDIDSSGNAYVTGETLSSVDYPTTAGAFSRTLKGDYEVFVTKLNPTGSALVYSTFLGGSLSDNGERVSVDSGGNAYVMGFSGSSDFPTTPGAFDTSYNGSFDVTLTKLNPAGSALVYSTFLGTTDFDSGNGLTVDAAGSAYVTGSAPLATFPTTPGAYDTTFNNSDGFVTKFNPAGSGLVYSTFIGGSDFDAVNSIVLDPAGNAWLGGGTSSVDYPVTADASDSTYNGSGDATIAELNSTGSALLFSTFLGGSNGEGSYEIAREPAGGGDVVVTGKTFSQDFPATVGAFDRVWNGDLSIFWGDGFVTRLDLQADGSTPPAPPAVPSAPGLISPTNGSSEPQPITFHWNVASSAVSYTIQIDDSSGFTAPLVRQGSVTDPVFVASGLATTTHFWRVRGVNSAGVAGPWSSVRSFTPQTAPPPSRLSTIDLNPSSVVGGNASSGTVVMDTSATDGAVISVSSSNPAVASVPATTTVAPNGFTGSFAVTTSAVAANTTVTITASYNGDIRSALLTVTPASAGPTLQSVTVSPSSVTGGNNTSAFVSLSSGAPAGGATVSLSSSNPSVLSVPASVTVGEGTTAAGFTVTTSSVSSTTSVTVSATYGGITRTAIATVTAASPPPPPPPPPGNVTITVSATGRSGERVTSSPSGISVATGSSGSASFTSGTSITLSVSNGRDAIWSGACSSGGNKTKTCTFTANSTATVTANVQ